ncbi:MAG: hypothetical protein PHS84_15045 [Paludibacter sp.]|nr:hypothetical protein [Paludibacter sp.]
MRQTLLIGLLIATLFGLAQTNNSKSVLTEKYSGKYSFGEDVEKGSIGSMTVFAETDTTILFFIDICRGAPSYNLGQHYDRLKIKNGKGIYFSKYKSNKKGCKWELTIDSDTLTLKTIDNCYACGFGGNVIADNKYIRKGLTRPEFFIDGHGHKIFFSKTSPENYLK